MADEIDNSALLEHDGIGHGQYYRNDCFADHLEKYLTTLETPLPGTHCEAVYPMQPPAVTTTSSGGPAVRPVHPG